jgi:hypothetical protein
MQGFFQSSRERAIIQSILRLENDPQAFVGLQFLYRYPRSADSARVEVTRVDAQGETFAVRRVDDGRTVEGVEPAQLSIGRGRTADKPLIRLMGKHGFDPDPYLQPVEEFRTPPSGTRSATGSRKEDARGAEEEGGFRSFRRRSPAVSASLGRGGSDQAQSELRSQGRDWVPRAGQSPFEDAGRAGYGGMHQAPFAPAPIRRVQEQMPPGFGMGMGRAREPQFQDMQGQPMYGQQQGR